jgi:hypothetical protein
MTGDSVPRESAVETFAVTPELDIAFSFLVATSILDLVFVACTKGTGLSLADALGWLSSKAIRVTCPS